MDREDAERESVVAVWLRADTAVVKPIWLAVVDVEGEHAR
jgi:hypothetical protein